MLNIIASVVLSLMAVKSFDDAVDKRVKGDIEDIVDVAENELRHQGYKDGFRDGVKDALFGRNNKFQTKDYDDYWEHHDPEDYGEV